MKPIENIDAIYKYKTDHENIVETTQRSKITPIDQQNSENLNIVTPENRIGKFSRYIEINTDIKIKTKHGNKIIPISRENSEI